MKKELNIIKMGRGVRLTAEVEVAPSVLQTPDDY